MVPLEYMAEFREIWHIRANGMGKGVETPWDQWDL